MRLNGHKALIAGAALGVLVLASGCTSIKNHRGFIAEQVLLDAIQPGIDNRMSVERTLGRPTFVSQFGNKDWYYVSQDTKTPAFRRPRTADQTVLRIRFDAGDNVIAIDRRGMEKVARIDPEGDKTPTLGRERSFLEDLFGNVGTVGAPGAGPGAPRGPGPNGS
ncbi:MAG: outer membrane protein assembly factor BamE [Sphingomonadaceae bacterium]|jgi:outer membrane protein assembly factor BamE (lipoprotein component of BamABCDE complex)